MAKFLDWAGLQDLVNKIKTLIPTKTSELTNDSGFITSPGYSYEPQQKDIVPEQTATTTFDREEGIYWGWLTLAEDVRLNEYTEIPQTLKVEYAGETYEVEEQTFAGKNLKYYGATRNSSGTAVSTWNYPFCITFEKSSGTSKTSSHVETKKASTNTIHVYAEESVIVVTNDFRAAVQSIFTDGNEVSY